MSVGHILSMLSLVLGISFVPVVLYNFSCGCSREKKMCVQIWHLLFLHKQQWEISTMLQEWVLRACPKGTFCLHRVCAICKDHLRPQIGMSRFSLVLMYCVASAFPSLMHRAMSCQRPYSLQSCLSLMYSIVHSSFDLISNRLIYTEKKHMDITEETRCFSVFLLTFSFSI